MGCHVFADGSISLTCDELSDCEADADTDADTNADFTLSAGIARSLTVTESWLASAYDPPDFTAHIEKGGAGSTAGAVAYSAETDRLYVADNGALFVFGPGSDNVNTFELPVVEPVIDIEPIGQSLYLITEHWLLIQSGPAQELTLINDNGDDLGFASMTAEDTTLYIVSDANAAGPDLYAFDTQTDLVETIATGFDNNSARVDGDIFFGTDGELMACSMAGAIYSIDEMLSGSTAAVRTYVSNTIDDVLTCGQDPDSGRYLVASASEGLYVIASGEDDLLLTLTTSSLTTRGAHIY